MSTEQRGLWREWMAPVTSRPCLLVTFLTKCEPKFEFSLLLSVVCDYWSVCPLICCVCQICLSDVLCLSLTKDLAWYLLRKGITTEFKKILYIVYDILAVSILRISQVSNL